MVHLIPHDPDDDANLFLALDAGLTVEDIAPFDEAPPVAGRGTAQMMLYLGGG